MSWQRQPTRRSSVLGRRSASTSTSTATSTRYRTARQSPGHGSKSKQKPLPLPLSTDKSKQACVIISAEVLMPQRCHSLYSQAVSYAGKYCNVLATWQRGVYAMCANLILACVYGTSNCVACSATQLQYIILIYCSSSRQPDNHHIIIASKVVSAQQART